MVSIDDGTTSGAAGVTGNATGVAGAGAGRTGAASAAATSNTAAVMGATANVGAALPEYATGAACAASAGTATVVASTRSGRTGNPRSTGTSTDMAAMFRMTNSGTARTTGTASQEDLDKTRLSISLPARKANLAKCLEKTPTYNQCRLAAQIHAFLLQDSLNLTRLNDAGNKPVMGIINIP